MGPPPAALWPRLQILQLCPRLPRAAGSDRRDQIKPPCSWEVTGSIQAISLGFVTEAQGAEADPKAHSGNPRSQPLLLPVTGGSLGTPRCQPGAPSTGGLWGSSPAGLCGVGRRLLQPMEQPLLLGPAFHRKRGWEQRPGDERRKASWLLELPSTGQGPAPTHQHQPSAPPALLLLLYSPGITAGQGVSHAGWGQGWGQ